MSEPQEELCFCPTFNSFSSVAETAARITADDGDGDSSGEFEFNLVSDGAEIFYDGQFGPVFPIFNRDLVETSRETGRESDREIESNPIPSLKDLFLRESEEGAAPSSCSSSEVDETEALAPGTYCVWRPKIVTEPPSPSICKKSNSTGSGSSSTSKRWKFLNLLRRSNSEGKDTYVFLTPKPAGKEKDKAVAKAAPKPKSAVAAASPSAHEAFYVHNRAIKQGDKKKSYLPYRKDLVGFFANVNSLGRS